MFLSQIFSVPCSNFIQQNKNFIMCLFVTVTLVGLLLSHADQMVQCLGKPAAVPEVPGSKPG